MSFTNEHLLHLGPWQHLLGAILITCEELQFLVDSFVAYSKFSICVRLGLGLTSWVLSTIDEAMETKCLLNLFPWSQQGFKSSGIDFALLVGLSFFSAFHDKQEFCLFSSSSSLTTINLTLFTVCTIFVVGMLKVSLWILSCSHCSLKLSWCLSGSKTSLVSQDG